MIVLYDGVCGLCNKVTQFILPRDKDNRFQFAALQSDFGRQMLQKHGKPVEEMDTVYVVVDAGQPTERLLDRAQAAFGVLRQLGGGWAVLATARVLPNALLNVGYNFVARHRYGWFGKTDSCQVPRPEWRHKFIG